MYMTARRHNAGAGPRPAAITLQPPRQWYCAARIESRDTYKPHTYKSVLVGDVVGELELVEAHELLHPRLPRARRVRVDVHALGHFRIRFAGHQPPAANTRRDIRSENEPVNNRLLCGTDN